MISKSGDITHTHTHTRSLSLSLSLSPRSTNQPIIINNNKQSQVRIHPYVEEAWIEEEKGEERRGKKIRWDLIYLSIYSTPHNTN